jgi:two-component system CheB/CheR fusion protein
MLLTNANLFVPLDIKCRVFAKVPDAGQRPRAPVTLNGERNENPVTRNSRLRELVLEESPVARIVVDDGGVLAMANQKARMLFSINERDVGRPLQDLEISHRPAELRKLIEEAYIGRRTVTQTSVERRFEDGETQYFDIVVAPLLSQGESPYGVAITYLDVTHYGKLQDDLKRSREQVQVTNEQLQSSNQELETTTEELQSTNEELETMNEELQSTNEELQTVNEELRQRTDEMNQLNAFFASVLGSLRQAAVVVNHNLNVLIWNHRAEDLWGLRADEVQGEDLISLDIGLPVGELEAPLEQALSSASSSTDLHLEAVNRRGRSVTCEVRVMPLVSAKQGLYGGIVLMRESGESAAL